jgi:hypothetical protein
MSAEGNPCPFEEYHYINFWELTNSSPHKILSDHTIPDSIDLVVSTPSLDTLNTSEQIQL